MAVIVVRSTDVGAPLLPASAGALLTLLDFALVTKLGWTKPYTGVNKAVYRQAGGYQRYMRILDTNAAYGLVTGYESMSDVDTGTGPNDTPDTRRLIEKGANKDKWAVVGDSRTFYLLVHGTSGFPAAGWLSCAFGDIFSFKRDDAYRCGMWAGSSRSNLNIYSTGVHTAQDLNELAGEMATRLMRSYTGALGGITPSFFGDVSLCHSSDTLPSSRSASIAPALDYGLDLAEVHVGETVGPAIRGQMRGLWHWCHRDSDITDQAERDGAGDLFGKRFLFFKPMLGNESDSVLCLETSDTWPTNVDGL